MIYNLNDLQQAHQAGKTYKYIFFWGHQPSVDGSVTASCLSQWWQSNFKIDDQLYSCTEQYMMAEKARLFQDEEMLREILKAKHPKEMKAFGRAVRNFDKQIWDDNCFEIVKRGNLEKFSQNEELCQFLLSTRKRILVEASPRDRIWGIGMGKHNPDAGNPMKWRGKNLLGFALTEVRDILLTQSGEESSD